MKIKPNNMEVKMSFTTNLDLFKHDNPEENEDLFDVTKSLNENWDKIDKYVYEQEAGRQEKEATREANEEERKSKETEREKAEDVRKSNEEDRKNAEEERGVNEEQRISNEEAREKYISELKQKVEDGEFKGDPNILSIGTVETGEEASVEITGNSPTQTLNLVLPKGDKGEQGKQGETGKGIQSIALKEGSHIAGQFDTYLITFTDGTTTEFQVYNGQDGNGSFTGNYEDLINKPIYYWDGKSSDTNPNNVALWQNIVDIAEEKTCIVIVNREKSGSSPLKGVFLFYRFSNYRGEVGVLGTPISSSVSSSSTGSYTSQSCLRMTLTFDLSTVGIVSKVSDVSLSTSKSDYFLPANKTTVTNYTPTYDYHPATKKYVDDTVGNISNILDNINGEVI